MSHWCLILFVYCLCMIWAMFSFCWSYCCCCCCLLRSYCCCHSCSVDNIGRYTFAIDQDRHPQSTYNFENFIFFFAMNNFQLTYVNKMQIIHTMDNRNPVSSRTVLQLYSNNPKSRLHHHQFHTNKIQLQDFYCKLLQFGMLFPTP